MHRISLRSLMLAFSSRSAGPGSHFRPPGRAANLEPSNRHSQWRKSTLRRRNVRDV